MASTIKQRLRRFNGTDYDTVHLETHANSVLVDVSFVNPLNTDQLTLGDGTVYFKAYPDLKWQVQHLDGDYVYLALTTMTELTQFNPTSGQTTYAGSVISTKCINFLNNAIPNVVDYLENVTVNGVTAKVFIPSYKMFSGTASSDGGDANDPTFDWPSTSATNRICNYQGSASQYWLSSRNWVPTIWNVDSAGDFDHYGPTNSRGFRPCVKVRYKNSSGIVETDTLDHVLEGIVPSSVPLDVYSDNTQKCNTLIFQTTLTASSGTALNYPILTSKLKATYGNVNAYFNALTAYKYLQFKLDIVSAGIEVIGGATTYVGMIDQGVGQNPIPLGYHLQQLNTSITGTYYVRNMTLWSHVFIKYVHIDGNVSGFKAGPAWLTRVRYMDSLDIGKGNSNPPGFTYNIDTYDTSSSSYGNFDAHGRLCWPFNRTDGTASIIPFASTAGATNMTFSIYGSN